MLKRIALPTALLVSTLGFALAPATSARDRDDWGRNNRHEARERQEWREHERRELREREWREHERRERWRRTHGYFDRFGYWHPYGY